MRRRLAGKAEVSAQASVPPTAEAITIPSTTQHMIIMIFFCMIVTIRLKRVIKGRRLGVKREIHTLEFGNVCYSMEYNMHNADRAV